LSHRPRKRFGQAGFPDFNASMGYLQKGASSSCLQ
jgi:hypothetical protein